MKVVLVCIWMKENERVKPLLCCLFEPLFHTTMLAKPTANSVEKHGPMASIKRKKRRILCSQPCLGDFFICRIWGDTNLAFNIWHGEVGILEAIHNQWGWVEELKLVPMGWTVDLRHWISLVSKKVHHICTTLGPSPSLSGLVLPTIPAAPALGAALAGRLSWEGAFPCLDWTLPKSPTGGIHTGRTVAILCTHGLWQLFPGFLVAKRENVIFSEGQLVASGFPSFFF